MGLLKDVHFGNSSKENETMVDFAGGGGGGGNSGSFLSPDSTRSPGLRKTSAFVSSNSQLHLSPQIRKHSANPVLQPTKSSLKAKSAYQGKLLKYCSKSKQENGFLLLKLRPEKKGYIE